MQSIGNLQGDRQRVIEYDKKEGDFVGELRATLVIDRVRPARMGSDAEDSSAVTAARTHTASPDPQGWEE